MKCIFISTIHYLSRISQIQKWHFFRKSRLIFCYYFSRPKSLEINCSISKLENISRVLLVTQPKQGCIQEFFRAGEVTWNKATSISISCTNIKGVTGKKFRVFLVGPHKTAFYMRAFFPQPGHFSI